MFGPIKPRETAADACARALRRAILRGDLVAGDRLPPERELAAEFQLTRPTLRAALAQLSASGLVTARQGSGYVVQDYARRGGPDLLPSLVALARERGRFADVCAELLSVRRHLARALLERLAAGVSKRRRADIARAVDRFAEAIERGAGSAELAEADLAVVAAAVDAAGSAVLRLFLNPITRLLAELPRLRDAVYAEPRENLAAYRALLSWLEASRSDLTGDIAAELLRRDEAALAQLAGARRRGRGRSRSGPSHRSHRSHRSKSDRGGRKGQTP